jgi:hypothetical protein
MDRFGKAAWIFFFAGAVVLPLMGCSKKPDGQFQTYDHLKKSTETASSKSERKKVAENSGGYDSGMNPWKPAQAPVTKKADAPKVTQAEPGAAPKSPAVAGANLPGGTKVTDAAFQASVASTGPKLGAIPVSATTRPHKFQLLVPNRKFKTEGPQGAWRVSYDDIDLLKVLNMDPVPPDAADKFPAWLKGLDGQRIRIRGFMFPPFSQTGIHAFGLARDNQICCFGRNPKIYDVFDVHMRDGVTTEYLPNRPFDVVGVFHIRPEAEEGKLFRLYEIDDATVIAK